MSDPVHRLRVRYVECDMQGHVFNGHYLAYLDEAYAAFLASSGFPYTALLDEGLDVVVAEANVRYRSPARFEDELEVDVALEGVSETSMTTRYAICRGDALLTEATLRHVCVGRATAGKMPWPPPLRAALAARHATAPR